MYELEVSQSDRRERERWEEKKWPANNKNIRNSKIHKIHMFTS